MIKCDYFSSLFFQLSAVTYCTAIEGCGYGVKNYAFLNSAPRSISEHPNCANAASLRSSGGLCFIIGRIELPLCAGLVQFQRSPAAPRVVVVWLHTQVSPTHTICSYVGLIRVTQSHSRPVSVSQPAGMRRALTRRKKDRISLIVKVML